jgi:hypothetical protein
MFERLSVEEVKRECDRVKHLLMTQSNLASGVFVQCLSTRMHTFDFCLAVAAEKSKLHDVLSSFFI